MDARLSRILMGAVISALVAAAFWLPQRDGGGSRPANIDTVVSDDGGAEGSSEGVPLGPSLDRDGEGRVAAAPAPEPKEQARWRIVDQRGRPVPGVEVEIKLDADLEEERGSFLRSSDPEGVLAFGGEPLGRAVADVQVRSDGYALLGVVCSSAGLDLRKETVIQVEALGDVVFEGVGWFPADGEFGVGPGVMLLGADQGRSVWATADKDGAVRLDAPIGTYQAVLVGVEGVSWQLANADGSPLLVNVERHVSTRIHLGLDECRVESARVVRNGAPAGLHELIPTGINLPDGYCDLTSASGGSLRFTWPQVGAESSYAAHPMPRVYAWRGSAEQPGRGYTQWMPGQGEVELATLSRGLLKFGAFAELPGEVVVRSALDNSEFFRGDADAGEAWVFTPGLVDFEWRAVDSGREGMTTASLAFAVQEAARELDLASAVRHEDITLAVGNKEVGSTGVESDEQLLLSARFGGTRGRVLRNARLSWEARVEPGSAISVVVLEGATEAKFDLFASAIGHCSWVQADSLSQLEEGQSGLRGVRVDFVDAEGAPLPHVGFVLSINGAREGRRFAADAEGAFRVRGEPGCTFHCVPAGANAVAAVLEIPADFDDATIVVVR